MTTGQFPSWMFIVCILAGLPTVALQAEENVGLSGASPSLAALSINLALVSRSSLYAREQVVRLGFDSRFTRGLKELAAERELNDTLPKLLLRKQLISSGEGPRTKVRPGFGQFFSGETIEPLRTSGAGVDDSRYVFVKLSFRF